MNNPFSKKKRDVVDKDAVEAAIDKKVDLKQFTEDQIKEYMKERETFYSNWSKKTLLDMVIRLETVLIRIAREEQKIIFKGADDGKAKIIVPGKM